MGVKCTNENLFYHLRHLIFLMKRHREAEWLFDYNGRDLLPRTLVHKAKKERRTLPLLQCPCCNDTLAATSVVRHYYASRERAEEGDDQEEENKEEDNERVEGEDDEQKVEDDNQEEKEEEDDQQEVVEEVEHGTDEEGQWSEEDSTDEDEDEDEDEEQWQSALSAIKKFAQGLLDDTVHNGSQANTVRFLKTAHATILPLLPFGLQRLIPKSFKGLHSAACGVDDIRPVFHEFCPRDHYMFDPADPATIVCPVCEKDTRLQSNGRPTRQAVYFELSAYVKRIMTMPGMLQAQQTWEDRRSPAGTYRDASDGSIMSGTHLSKIFEQVPPEQRKNCIIMSMCTDATQVRDFGNKGGGSMTPVTCQVLTLPDNVRKKASAMYLAVVSPNGASDSVFLQPIADMFSAAAPGTEGIEVNGTTFWVIKGWRVDDLGGISQGIRAKKYPALNGACIQCRQQGCSSKAHNTTIYMGAFAHLPLDPPHELRLRLADAYKKEESIKMRALTQAKPRNMTAALAYASAARVEAGYLDADQLQLECFHGFNVWTQTLYYFNIIFQTINDPFHEIANTIRDIFNLLRNYGKGMHYGQRSTRRAYELAIGRFEGDERAPFHISNAAKQALDNFVQSGQMRLPSSWPRVRFGFTHFNRHSCSEKILLAGPLGLYYLQFCDIDPEIRSIFVDLVNCLKQVQAKTHTTASLGALQAKMVTTLTKCEASLPLFWNTCVRHHLLLLVSFIERCGPYDTFSMGPFERFHTIFKKLLRAKCGEMQSIVNHYSLLVSGDRWRCEADQSTPAPTAVYSNSLAGVKQVDYDVSDIEICGKQTQQCLDPLLYAQIQDMWCVRFKVYDKLRDRYRTEHRRRAGRARGGFRDSQTVQISSGWSPRGGRPLTTTEEQWLQMTPTITTFSKAMIKGKYQFRTMKSERFNKTSNSIVKEWYSEVEGGVTKGYGMIKDMFLHQAYPGGPVLHFVKAEWLDVLPELSCTGLTQVQRNANNNFNINSCFTVLEQIVPYNIALLPQKLNDPECTVFAVIDPEARLGSYIDL